jgi:hypothetical protein
MEAPTSQQFDLGGALGRAEQLHGQIRRRPGDAQLLLQEAQARVRDHEVHARHTRVRGQQT